MKLAEGFSAADCQQELTAELVHVAAIGHTHSQMADYKEIELRQQFQCTITPSRNYTRYAIVSAIAYTRSIKESAMICMESKQETARLR